MELDLIDVTFDLHLIKPGELAEIFEDPFAIRFLPDNERNDGATRYYALGRTICDRYLFVVFSTDGKMARIITARDMSESEQRFYDRNYNQIR